MNKLVLSDIPSPVANWEVISDFAVSYDGYKACGSLEACAEIANAKKHDSLENLRICLFYEQRKWRWNDENPDVEAMIYIRSILEKIRVLLNQSG
jgi:hypothetical protein